MKEIQRWMHLVRCPKWSHRRRGTFGPDGVSGGMVEQRRLVDKLQDLRRRGNVTLSQKQVDRN